ncbi:MAG: hypothetical protein NXI24_04210 [bacterium]|nr:hypothetical protein [bacterium]
MLHSGIFAGSSDRRRALAASAARGLSRIALLICLMPLVFAASCAETGEQEMDLLFQTDVVNRGQAKEMLRMGIRINVNVCPTNTVAGYYAIQATIPEELNYPHYEGSLVSNCSLLLAVAPCLPAEANQAFLVNYYRGLIQVCGLKQVGF